jgi:flagellar protein FliO/FliZ
MSATLATGTASSGAGTTGLANVALSLLLVVGLIVALAWLVARLRGVSMPGQPGPLRVAAATSLGLKERLLLVEAAGEWLLLAVTPGGVNLLHRYAQKPEGLAAPVAGAPFAQLLERLRKPGGAP